MIKLGSEAERQIKAILLTRYACYLISQSRDPKREQITFAKKLFCHLNPQTGVIGGVNPTYGATASSKIDRSKNIYKRGVYNI
jgi:DNA-damage-inducible protein D